MSTGTVIEVRREIGLAGEAARVEVRDERDGARYETLLTLVTRLGCWLSGPQAQLLPREQWEAQFEGYQEQLEELRELGDELRPRCLREPVEMLVGEALVGEVLELFAA